MTVRQSDYMIRVLEIVDWRITIEAESGAQALRIAEERFLSEGFSQGAFAKVGSECDYWELLS